MADSKAGFVTTPSGAERSMLTIHGALLCDKTIVLLGYGAATIDFKQYDTETGALDVFNRLATDLVNADVPKGGHFIKLPNGNLLRKEQIMAIELCTSVYEGFILRNKHNDIVDFVAISDDNQRNTFKDELLKSISSTTQKNKFYQPDWKKLGIG